MINNLLILAISLYFLYLFYDQFGMERLKGETKLKVRLKKRAKLDGLIFIGLIAIILYQTQARIDSLTLYLLTTAIILSLYTAFIRAPQLMLKSHGFFFENLYIGYDKIQHIDRADNRAANRADNAILVITLKNEKQLVLRFDSLEPLEQVVAFFGGYKSTTGAQS